MDVIGGHMELNGMNFAQAHVQMAMEAFAIKAGMAQQAQVAQLMMDMPMPSPGVLDAPVSVDVYA